MNTVQEVMAALEEKGAEQTRKTMARHGAPDNMFGVKIAELKMIAKRIKGKQESIACSGWNTYAGIISTSADDDLDLAEIAQLLDRVVNEIADAPDSVRYVMNNFVISVGSYVKPLLKQAAKTIGTVSVDMGDTACKVPNATAYIKKIETTGRVGKKRKSVKC